MSSSSCYCYSGNPDTNSKDLGMPQFKKVVTGILGVCCEAYIRTDMLNVGACNTQTITGNSVNFVLDQWCATIQPNVLYTQVRAPSTGFDGIFFESSSNKIHQVTATIHIDDVNKGGARRLELYKQDGETNGNTLVTLWDTQPVPDPDLYTPLTVNASVPLAVGDRLFLQVVNTGNANATVLAYPYTYWSVTETPYFVTTV